MSYKEINLTIYRKDRDLILGDDGNEPAAQKNIHENLANVKVIPERLLNQSAAT